MSARFFSPFPQFLDSTPNVRSGAQLFFYEAGTSTKLDTYSDEDLTSANTNPVVLNSSGFPDTDIFMQDQAYKVVLAPSTDSDPPTSPIWTADNYYATDFQSVAQMKVGSGSPSGSVAGTAGSSGVLPDTYWDFTNDTLYFCTTTGDASSAGWTAINASSSTPSVPRPQGYLTLVSGTPVITSDQASATTVYYTPDKGNLIPIYDGSSFVPTEFSELSLSLVTQHAADTIYDLWVWSESGVITLGTGPAWSDSSAGSGDRGSGASSTELTRINGILVNAVQITTRNGATTYTVNANRATYVGSIFMDGTNGQVTCHRSFGQSRKWGLWNAYNRRPIALKAGDATASWTYGSSSFRSSNNDSSNSATVFVGLAEELVSCSFSQNTDNSSGDDTLAQIGIGVNSTSSASGFAGRGNTNLSGSEAEGVIVIVAQHSELVGIGISNINALENAPSAGTQIFFGGNEDMQLTAEWMG